MALSPADFYAYSRATGAPVPEDPEERAQMAPEVAEFRRNQLKAPEQGQQQGQNALASLAGIGALALAGVGAYRLAKGRLPKGPSRSATAPVVTGDIVREAERTGVVRRAAAETTPAPSKVATPGEPTPEERQRVYAEVAQKSPEELPRVYRPKGGTQKDLLITDPNTGEVFRAGKSPSSFAERYISLRPELKGQKTNLPLERTPGTFKEFSQEAQQFTPRQYLESTGSLEADPTDRLVAEMGEFQAARKKQLESRMGRAYGQQLEKTADDLLEQLQTTAPDLTTIQQSSAGAQQNQFINAVESGEDQLVGRVIKMQGLADPWGESTIPPTVINKQTTTPLLPAAAVTLREKAQSFLQSTFEDLGKVIPGRYRRERAMGLDPEIAEAVELYASTGDPNVLSRLSANPSSPLTVSPRVQTELKETEIPTGKFYQPTGKSEFVEDLFEKDISLTNKISTLGAQKQAIINRIQEIDELEPQLRFAAADEPGPSGGYYTRTLNKLLFEKQSLNPESVNADLGDALAQRNFVRNQMESLESLGTQYKLLNRQEGVRPFFEVDPVTNEPIVETLEVRSGRPSVELEEQKTSGGRSYAMYDPETQTKSSIGVYGVEPRNYPIADPELKPTALQREETKATLLLKPEGITSGYRKMMQSRGLEITPDEERLAQETVKAYTQQRQLAKAVTPEQKRNSIQVSEALRRATIEGRDPQAVLRQLGFNV